MRVLGISVYAFKPNGLVERRCLRIMRAKVHPRIHSARMRQEFLYQSRANAVSPIPGRHVEAPDTADRGVSGVGVTIQAADPADAAVCSCDIGALTRKRKAILATHPLSDEASDHDASVGLGIYFERCDLFRAAQRLQT